MIGYLDSRKASYFQKNELTKDEKKAYNKRCTRNKKIFCATGIILNVGMLAFTKYFNFVGESVSAITGGTFTALDIIVPLGISFYTFQSTGYLIDVYRGMYEPQKNPMKYALFILFFPQIMQGPIGRYNDLAPQLFEPCKFDYDRLKSGLVRMLWGFFKKMVIADRAALLVNTVFDNWKPYSGAVIWTAVFLYAVQLYADFSGYMDIALGAGEALGIRLSENFRTPYFQNQLPNSGADGILPSEHGSGTTCLPDNQDKTVPESCQEQKAPQVCKDKSSDYSRTGCGVANNRHMAWR